MTSTCTAKPCRTLHRDGEIGSGVLVFCVFYFLLVIFAEHFSVSIIIFNKTMKPFLYFRKITLYSHIKVLVCYR